MPIRMTKLTDPRAILFFLICGLSLILNWAAVKNLIALSLRVDEYSHTIVIPFLAAAIIYSERAKIFATVRYSFRVGFVIVTAAVLIGMFFGANAPVAGQNGAFALRIMSLALIWTGTFVLCFGWEAFRTGKFALIFLLLTVPIPNDLLGKVIYLVRWGSSEVASFWFAVFNVPVFREKFSFMLSTVTIEVATECSGIHSTMALLIVTLLAAHLFVRSKLKRTVLVLSAIPIVCFSNGVRIAALTLLSIYVNKGFLYGRLHHEGGFLFFGLALFIMAAELYLMGFRLGPPRQKAIPDISPSVLPAGK